jgi:hypothetical protein
MNYQKLPIVIDDNTARKQRETQGLPVVRDAGEAVFTARERAWSWVK